MYEVYLEKAAENDLKRLPTTTFQRIISQIRTLLKIRDLQVAVNLPAQRTIGVFELETIVSFTRSMRRQRS